MPRPPCFALAATTFTGRPLSTSLSCSLHPQRRIAPRRVYAEVAESASDPEPPNSNVVEEEVPPLTDEPQISQPPVADDTPVPDDDVFETNVPGKFVLDELTLAKQKTELDKYATELRRKRLSEDREAAKLFGFVPYAETLNGRLAMFFILTGLLTEYWTGYNIPDQVELMLRTLGIL